MSHDMDYADAGQTVKGDPGQRVTVSMPKSLHDLRQVAQRHFARSGEMKMYHHGVEPITHHHHMTKLKPGDVVVVSQPEPRQYEAPTLTTHQAHYIKHPLEAHDRAGPRASSRTASLPFEGVTSYTADFVRHPLEAKKQSKPPKPAWEKGTGATGRSMYAMHYPWHDIEVRPPMKTADCVQNTGPFHGVSSYRIDFVRHNERPRSAVRHAPHRAEPPPFEGVSTYASDYIKQQADRSAPALAREGALKTGTAPFQGNSEYKREYIKLATEAPVIIHLEPEHRPSREGSRPRRS